MNKKIFLLLPAIGMLLAGCNSTKNNPSHSKEEESTTSENTSQDETSKNSDTASETSISEDTTSEDTTSEDVTSEDTTSEDTTSEDTTSEETTSEDTSSQEETTLSDYYIKVGSTKYQLEVDQNSTLSENQTGQYIISIDTVTKGDAVSFYYQETAIESNIGSDKEDATNKNLVQNNTIHNDANNVAVYFKTWKDGGYSYWLTGYEKSEEETTYTIYFRDASWWNKDAASTNYVTWKDTKPTGLGQMMTHIQYIEASHFNYWSCEVPADAAYIMFIRTGDNGTADWGARTVEVDLSTRGTNDMYDISNTTAGWYGEGNSITGTWTTYTR